MDSNQVVPGQLPDENDIERLFPKCPPTTPGKKSFSNSRKSQRKVQRHSRKELEARRNKFKALQRRQQQQQQHHHHQQQQLSQQIKRQLRKDSSKGKSTVSSDDNTGIGCRLNSTNKNNDSSNSLTKKDNSSSKQTVVSGTAPRTFPHVSSIAPLATTTTTTTNNDSQRTQNETQTLSTYGQSTELNQTPVATETFVNVQTQISNRQSLLFENYEQQVSQYSSVKANNIDNDAVATNQAVKEKTCVGDSLPKLSNTLHSSELKRSDDEKFSSEDLEIKQNQQATGLDNDQPQQHQPEQQIILTPTKNESGQYFTVKAATDVDGAENNNNQDYTSNDTNASKSLYNNIQLDNECGQDKTLLKHTQSNSDRRVKLMSEIIDKCSLKPNNDEVVIKDGNNNSNILDYSPPESAPNVQSFNNLLDDDERMNQTVTQQLSFLDNLELLNESAVQFTTEPNETVVIKNSSDIELSQPKSPTIQLETFSEVDEDVGPDRSFDTRVPSLRHHKLPNESSHYSIVRVNSNNIDNNNTSQASSTTSSQQACIATPLSTLKEEEEGRNLDRLLTTQLEETNPRQLEPIAENGICNSIVKSNINIVSTENNNDNSLIPPRSSSLQFNTLSDVDESGAEDIMQSSVVANQSDRRASHMTNYLAKNCDLSSPPSHRPQSNSKLPLDDEFQSATKTAPLFPCLYEGLSSESESCQDEIEDDDEKAVDADVDADDEEEEEEDDDDDDAEEDIIDRDLAALQLGQTTGVDCYGRQQQSKTQYRLNGSSRQQATNSRLSEQPEHHQLKSAGPVSYGVGSSYVNQDLFEQDENLKAAAANFSNHQGQANHWMGSLPNPQQTNLPPHPSSSQQHRNPRNSNNLANDNTNLSKNNLSTKRDEVKALNRLSSDTDNETDRLLGTQRNDQHLKAANNDLNGSSSVESHPVSNAMKHNANSKEVLIEGVLFNVKYLGSTHSDCEGRSEKEDRIHQAEMAVHEVKFRNGLNPESQTSTEVQLFISTEKIMVLDDKHRKIMMDHSLRTISYIADIGDAIVLIVKKKSNPNDTLNELGRPISKISCHVFESSESHTITKSISQAFQVAYTELLKANGTGDPNNYLPKEIDYQEVLNSQEMSTDELEMFARKENQREVIVPKKEGEIIGFGIVESGWGSVLPTVVIASLKHDGPAYRCKKLFIGDQILSINGISLVGLPLSDCQQILSKIKNQRVARLSVVPCPLIVEVKIKRPDVKYQLGFSVQNGVICSLLRGGIAERGGVRVGHRIISINGTAVVDVPHEKIVTLLASSVGEIRMKTCLTSLYRLILGEENPVYY